MKTRQRHFAWRHLGLGRTLSALACEEIGIQQPRPTVLSWIEEVNVTVKDLWGEEKEEEAVRGRCRNKDHSPAMIHRRTSVSGVFSHLVSRVYLLHCSHFSHRAFIGHNDIRTTAVIHQCYTGDWQDEGRMVSKQKVPSESKTNYMMSKHRAGVRRRIL